MSDAPIQFLDLPDVTGRVKLSKPTIYRKIAAGEFPAPVKVGRLSRWTDAQILGWQKAQMAS